MTEVSGNSFLMRWVFIPLSSRVLGDMAIMEEYLAGSCTDLDYTSVRPPGLYNGDASGKLVMVLDDRASSQCFGGTYP